MPLEAAMLSISSLYSLCECMFVFSVPHASAFPKMLNLGNNKLSGVISVEIVQLKAPLSLNLCFNNLSREIPQWISNLKNLKVLDLSTNHLTGTILLEILVKLSSFINFNISYNDLEGIVPIGGHFNTFPSSSFAKNPKLCNPMRLHHCNSEEAATAYSISRKQNINKVVRNQRNIVGWVGHSPRSPSRPKTHQYKTTAIAREGHRTDRSNRQRRRRRRLGQPVGSLVDLPLYPSSSSTCLEATRTFYSACMP